MESFAGLGAEMAEIAVRIAAIDGPTSTIAEVSWMVAAGRRIAGFGNAAEAYGTLWLERLLDAADDLPSVDGDAQGSDASDAGTGDTGAEDPGTSDGAEPESEPLPLLPDPAPESPRDRQRRLLRAKWLDRCRHFASAYRASHLTTAHIDVLARTLDRLEPVVATELLIGEEALLRIARASTPDSFGVHLRRRIDEIRADGGMGAYQRQRKDSRAGCWPDPETGMYKAFCELDPIRGAAVLRAIEERVDFLKRAGLVEGLNAEQIAAQAFYELVTDINAHRRTTPTRHDHADTRRNATVDHHNDHAADDADDGNGNVAGSAGDTDQNHRNGRHAHDDPANGNATISAGDAAHANHDDDDDDDEAEAEADEVTRVELLIVVDHETITHGQHTHTVCETEHGIPLPVPLVRSLCTTAAITVAIAGADGIVLSVGHCERFATREQRRALRAMYRTCAHPDCNVRFSQCQIHHVVPWEHHGPTDLHNLLPLCSKHHHLVHEGRWRLTIDPQRTLRWYRPNGALDRTTPFQPIVTPLSKRTPADSAAPATDEPDGPPPGPAPPTDSAAASTTSEPATRLAPRNATAASASDADERPRLFDPHAA